MAGPVYFAWVDSTETAFTSGMHRFDENVFSFEVSHAEGNFASLSLTIKNPRVGFLSAGRKQWAWLSWDREGTVEPLFFGRLVAIPQDIQGEQVILTLLARPANYAVLKAALAESLKVAPYYDPIFIDPARRSDPDTVLEGRSAAWAIDRVTHAVTISDILAGDGAAVDFTAAEVPYDSVKIRMGETPVRSVTVEGAVQWKQAASGFLDVTPVEPVVFTYSGKSLIDGWPKTGAKLNGGWYVVEGYAKDLFEVEATLIANFTCEYTNTQKKHRNGDTMSYSASKSWPVLKGGSFGGAVRIGGGFKNPALMHDIVAKYDSGWLDPFSDPPVNRPQSIEVTTIYVPLWKVETRLRLGYDAERPRTERIRFTLKANVQPIVTLAEEADTLLLTLSSVDIGVSTEGTGGEIPIGDLARRSYAPTTRGLQSLEYLICVARANLLIRSRAVEVTFDCPFVSALDLSCRKNARLFDDRLPGGQAVGKIISYSFGLDGASGIAKGSVTMGCAIGYGGAVTAVPGTPDYVEAGYVDPGYQTYSGHVAVLPGGDVGYSVPVDSVNDDGLRFPLTYSQAVIRAIMQGNLDDQEAAIEDSFESDTVVANATDTIESQQKAALAAKTTTDEILKTNATWYDLELKALTGLSFEAGYDIEVTDLEIPKMIDLEAA